VSWEPNEDNMFYASAAKGFRPAGASLRVPAICDFDLIQNGYVDENGDPFQPETFDSDSVWSYELGVKSRLFGGRFYVDGSVYRIEWSDIQANVSLPNCAYNFVDNLGNATSEGFDIAVSYMATERLMLTGAYGYNDPRFDGDAISPGGAIIFADGSSVPNAGAPETFSFTGEYTLPLGAYQGYARLDYSWSAEFRRVGDQVPTDPFFDPRLKPQESFGLLNLRLGVQYNNWDVSLFAQNLTNESPRLELSASSYYDPQDWSDVALRPRMVGLTATWRL